MPPHAHAPKPGEHALPALLLLPLAALVAVLPLILKGCSCGHDFDFHLLSWMEAASQFRHGVLHLHWAYSAAWNAGEPRFVFYPPLSWTLGGWLGLLLPWQAVPIVYTWFALTACGLGMYRFAREFASRNTAVLVAMLYIVNPYMLFTAYERTAYAELLAAAWLPLLLVGILHERVTVLGLAIPIALLWLTNAPAAVMGCYTVALIGLLRVLLSTRPSNAGKHTTALTVRITSGAALGLALAAWFILPAAYERRWVEINMAMVPGMRIADSFLFTHTADPDHDAVLRTASWIAIAILATLCLALAAAWRTRTSDRLPRQSTAILAILTAAIALLLTPLSAPLWRLLPEMQFLQFPWRLVMVLASAAGAALAIALRAINLQRRTAVLLVMLLVAASTTLAAKLFFQPCDATEAVASRVAVFNTHAGAEPTDEYTPKDADNDVLAPHAPAYWLADSPDAAPPSGQPAAPVPLRFTVESPHAEMLILHLRAYPAWQVLVNGVAATPAPLRADGLLAVPVPAGHTTIQLRYRRTTDETAGIAISLIALLVALFIRARSSPQPTPNRTSS